MQATPIRREDRTKFRLLFDRLLSKGTSFRVALNEGHGLKRVYENSIFQVQCRAYGAPDEQRKSVVPHLRRSTGCLWIQPSPFDKLRAGSTGLVCSEPIPSTACWALEFLHISELRVRRQKTLSWTNVP
jgi:hypothetical protein